MQRTCRSEETQSNSSHSHINTFQNICREGRSGEREREDRRKEERREYKGGEGKGKGREGMGWERRKGLPI